MSENKLEAIRIVIAEQLADIQKLFIPGMLLTFVARHPESPEMETVVTNDYDLIELQKTIERTIKRNVE